MKLGAVTLPAAASITTPPAPSPETSGAAGASVLQATGIAAANASPGLPTTTAQAARQAAEQINAFLKSSSSAVEFSVDGKSDQVIVRVVDSETNRLIRQIPSAEALAISQALDKLSGLLLNQKA